MSGLRLGIAADLLEERWPSMDLCAEMILAELERLGPEVVRPELIRPALRPRAQALAPLLAPLRRATYNADRLVNRHWDVPRALAARRDLDAVHVVDHSYAHIAASAPRGAVVGVHLHDLDAFRCLLAPALEPRPAWFRALARRTLHAVQRAAVVFCSTRVVLNAALERGLVDPARLVLAPLGVAPGLSPEGGVPDGPPHLLHVGSCIPRKRVDVLLEVLAALRAERPALRLIKVGGPWAPEHEALIAARGLGAAIELAPDVPRARLAELYRGAALVLQPSSGEGFSLPVVEALACGAPVLASDIPVHLEVGGPAARFCPVGDVPAWVATARTLLDDPAAAPARAARVAWGARFTWARHAELLLERYQALAGPPSRSGAGAGSSPGLA